MIYYNCHTHIFSAQYVPNSVVGIPVMNKLARFSGLRKTVKSLGWMPFRGKGSKLQRVIKFAEIGLSTSQEEIFNTLQDYYKNWGQVRFVVLMMDMEHMSAGDPLSNYATQINEIIRLRAKGNYADILLPFLFVDPRRREFVNGQALLDWVKPHFEKYGFVGIKMYPALGYYPFDEKLDELYGWLQENEIPVMYHTIKGVIHYRGTLKGLPEPRFASKYHQFGHEKTEDYQVNFTEPDNYHHLLKIFPKLKICLGHYGGDDVMLSNDKRWYSTIRELCSDPEHNVYTDVSFTLNNPEIFGLIHTDIQTPILGDRILFGTDYFVVEKNKDEAELRDELRESLSNQDKAKGIAIPSFDRIASVNAENFLFSKFYQG
jgi:uncharacterized protein